MTIRVQDFKTVTKANSIRELEQALQKRYTNGSNSFWLSHNDETKPSMSILVTGNLAYLHYFPSESHPGFASVGTTKSSTGRDTTTFFLDSPDQEQEILNSSILPFAKALEAATEFFHSRALPQNIEWTEL